MSEPFYMTDTREAERLALIRRRPDLAPEHVTRLHVVAYRDLLANGVAPSVDRMAAWIDERNPRGSSRERAIPDGLWSDAQWLAIVRFHKETRQSRPKIGTVAKAMDLSAQSIRDRLRRLGIDDWRAVHDLVAAGPPEVRD